MKAKKGLGNTKKGFHNVYTIAETGPKSRPIPPINTLQDERDYGVYCSIFMQCLPRFWGRKSMAMILMCVYVQRGNGSLTVSVGTRQSVCGWEG